MPTNDLLSLLCQYQVLERLAANLSTLDLFHLAKASSEFYAVIRGSERLFRRLMRTGLCDGRGLAARQEYKHMYCAPRLHWVFSKYSATHKAGQKTNICDEEIEVRVWNIKCDASDALPCLKCDVNVCEECRFVPRVDGSPSDVSRPRPHLTTCWHLRSIICYCSSCDLHVENDLPVRLSEYCDCNQYTRWICLPCKLKEDQPEGHYRRTRSKNSEEWEDGKAPVRQDGGIWLTDHCSYTAFWCPCGERAPEDCNIRCAWCRRRHDPQSWRREERSSRPLFEMDTCYPKMPSGDDEYRKYADLGYTGPIAP